MMSQLIQDHTVIHALDQDQYSELHHSKVQAAWENHLEYQADQEDQDTVVAKVQTEDQTKETVDQKVQQEKDTEEMHTTVQVAVRDKEAAEDTVAEEETAVEEIAVEEEMDTEEVAVNPAELEYLTKEATKL